MDRRHRSIRIPRASPYFAVGLTVLLMLSAARATELKTCRKMLIDRLHGAHPSLRRDDDIFYRDEDGRIWSDDDNIALNLQGCMAACGSEHHFYRDLGPRFTKWLIPIIILVGNIHFAPLSTWYSLWTILHLLGDPIDSMWSLLTKMEVLRRSYLVAEQYRRHDGEDEHSVRDRATLIAAEDELDGDLTSEQAEQCAQALRGLQGDHERLDIACSEAASELADCRVDETPRALLAILGYVITIISGFVEAIGGESDSQPGNRIAAGMVFSWLVPAVLLSATAGGFPSRRSCLRIIQRFTSLSLVPDHAVLPVLTRDRRSSLAGGKISTETFHDAQPWAGAIYSYRPNKWIFAAGPRARHPLFLLFLSALPVVFSIITAFWIAWFTPTRGLTCRNLTYLCIVVGWMASPAISWAMWKTRIATGKYLFTLTLIKDTLIGMCILGIIILQNTGIYNSCFCWSAWFSRGHRAVVFLNPDVERKQNAKSFYPAFVGANLALQFAIFFLMYWTDRHGTSLLRRSEKVRQKDFERVHDGRNRLDSACPFLDPFARREEGQREGEGPEHERLETKEKEVKVTVEHRQTV